MPRIDIAPTKSNLRKVKADLEFAYEGFELLNQKREILVIEIVKTIKSIKEAEEKLNKNLEELYAGYRAAAVDSGAEVIALKSFSESVIYKVNTAWTKLMGIAVPDHTVETETPGLNTPLFRTRASYDMLRECSAPVLKVVVDYASLAKKVFLLSAELKKVQRRVNALEKIFIPAREETKKYISDRLEEMEREEIFIKKLIGRRSS
ncbi:MAG TPA: V-type ATP synthase subunit D [Spirochaetota bacterium]|nr:V-type ATP synthase subunit D [Spirochaetota bacterium]HPJ34240.1 V-type ATP synthase subunit D [Spirochaetota bacterium]